MQAMAADVAEQVRRGVQPVGGGPLIEALSKSSVWKRVEEATFGSFVVADLAVFRR